MSYEYCILCEKDSAYKLFARALGGYSGSYHGHSYCLTHSVGHILELMPPEKQVSNPQLQAKLKSWRTEDLPWDHRTFMWKKQPTIKKVLTQIKKTAQQCNKMVIATDTDPSGEGDLLAWEILDYIHWKGPVLRMEFVDSETSIQKGFDDLHPIIDQAHHGAYQQAYARQKFDFLSMQLSRAATDQTRRNGFPVTVIRMGRLKSVIMALVAHQNALYDNYVKTPFYEVRYKDDQSNVFKRALKSDDPERFAQKQQAEQELNQFMPDTVVTGQPVLKHTAPPKLLDLSSLGARLAKQGYTPNEVLTVYQKMYEAKYISYPRTEDKGITVEQFNDLLPLVDQIAKVVGVDPQRLTVRTPRKQIIQKTAKHGANRPGEKVPQDLSELDHFDRENKAKNGCARAIYLQLARNYLAMLCDDYTYEQTAAHLAQHPDFKCTVNIPKAWGWKLVFQDDSDGDKATAKQLGKQAQAFVYEGANPRPKRPTLKFISKYLIDNNIGTGSTRLSTVNDLTRGKNAELKVVRGSYRLTPVGIVNAELVQGTMIGNTNVTRQLLAAMKEVRDFKQQPATIVGYADKIVAHDLPVITQNASQLTQKLSDKALKQLKQGKQREPKEKVELRFNGKQVTVNASWGGHYFTAQELQKLAQGKMITFVFTNSSGHRKRVTGSLQEQTYKRHKFVGFEPKKDAQGKPMFHDA